MANLTRLGRGATTKIHEAIDELFDKATARLLGPSAIIGKKIYISYNREFSLPGIFEAGSMEEYVKPDLDVLDSLVRVAKSYIDAHRERAKARVVHEINGALAEAKHKGGMSREDFRDLVNTKLSDVWAEVTRNVHSIVDTELAHTKNVSVLDGILGTNLNAGIDDPVVYFVVVRDNILCDECKRLHLMDDGKTPRLWYLSELGHGYHKKGEESPKIGGLHPHCRCTLVTLLPSYGFTVDGRVKYVKRGHLEIEEQRGLRRSEVDSGEPLIKTEWNPEDHPRDPATGEFVDHEKAVLASLKSNKMVWRQFEGDEEGRKNFFEHAKKAIRAAKKQNPDLYESLIKNPYGAMAVDLDDDGNLLTYEQEEPPEEEPETPEARLDNLISFAKQEIKIGYLEENPEAIQEWFERHDVWPQDRSTQVKILRALGVKHLSLAKEEALKYSGDPNLALTPYADIAFSPRALAMREQIENEYNANPIHSRLKSLSLIPGLNSLMFGYKDFAGGPHGQLLKYLGWRLDNFADYQNPRDAQQADELFDMLNGNKMRQRGGMRGLQGDPTYKGAGSLFTSADLKPWISRNLHLIDQWREHENSLQDKLHRENPSGSIVLARGYATNNPTKNVLISSFSDSKDYARPEGGAQKANIVKYYRIPIPRVGLSFHHAGPASWGDPRRGGARTSEHEWLIHPHVERILTPLEAENEFKLVYPHSTPGGKAVALVPKGEGGKLERDPTPPLRSGIAPQLLKKERSDVAAGAILYARDTGRYLVGHRSSKVFTPNTWGTFGGFIDSKEDPKEAAEREIREELKYDGPMELREVYVAQKPDFRYHNFIGIIPEEFEPKLNWEHKDAKWVENGKWPSPQHPGLTALVNHKDFKDATQDDKLEKMSLKAIPVGTKMPAQWFDTGIADNAFDYNHMLPQELKDKGYRMQIQHTIYGKGTKEPTHWLEAHIYRAVPAWTDEDIAKHLITKPREQWGEHEHKVYKRAKAQTNSYVIGTAVGQVKGKTLQPHFNKGVHPEFRGKGLGNVLYNALFGHAHNVLGAKFVSGHFHSDQAAKVHESLSRQHGMNYHSTAVPLSSIPTDAQSRLKGYAGENTAIARSAYRYAMKDEMNPNKPKLPHKSKRQSPDSKS